MCQNFEDCKKYREINTEIQEYEETIKKVSKKKKSKTGTYLGPQLTLSPEPDQDPKGNLMILEVNRGCVICVHCQRNPICTSKS